MPKIKVNDINIYYEIHGEGFPIVMIMGAGAPLNWWDEDLMEQLTKKYKTVVFDNRGIGQTDKPDIKYTIEMFVADTIGLMDALKIERAHVLGISLGGIIAQELALNHPERVEKLVLCATAPGVSFSVKLILRLLGKLLLFIVKRKMKTAESTYEYFLPQLFTKEFINEHPDRIEEVKPNLLAYTPSFEDLKRHLDASLTVNTRKRLKNLEVPTLILQGKKDRMNSYKRALELAELIPYSRLALFEKTAHALFTQEPQKVLMTLLQFLAE
ncbi:MAG: alpha/beta fold hydrolase [Promethearchaeota archaeon]